MNWFVSIATVLWAARCVLSQPLVGFAADYPFSLFSAKFKESDFIPNSAAITNIAPLVDYLLNASSAAGSNAGNNISSHSSSYMNATETFTKRAVTTREATDFLLKKNTWGQILERINWFLSWTEHNNQQHTRPHSLQPATPTATAVTTAATTTWQPAVSHPASGDDNSDTTEAETSTSSTEPDDIATIAPDTTPPAPLPPRSTPPPAVAPQGTGCAFAAPEVLAVAHRTFSDSGELAHAIENLLEAGEMVNFATVSPLFECSRPLHDRLMMLVRLMAALTERGAARFKALPCIQRLAGHRSRPTREDEPLQLNELVTLRFAHFDRLNVAVNSVLNAATPFLRTLYPATCEYVARQELTLEFVNEIYDAVERYKALIQNTIDTGSCREEQ